MKKERWVPLYGKETLYDISTSGQIRSKHAKSKRMILKFRKNSNGYIVCDIKKTIEGKVVTHSVHRLVALTFISNPDNKPFVNHINGDKTDFSIKNLEWCTRSENMLHANAMGLINHKSDKSRHNHSKAMKGRIEWDSNRSVRVIDISTNVIFPSVRKAAQVYGLKQSTLAMQLTGKNPHKTNLRYYEPND